MKGAEGYLVTNRVRPWLWRVKLKVTVFVPSRLAAPPETATPPVPKEDEKRILNTHQILAAPIRRRAMRTGPFKADLRQRARERVRQMFLPGDCAGP